MKFLYSMLMVGCLVAAGCQSDSPKEPPPIPSDHPAHPHAADETLPEDSSTLDVPTPAHADTPAPRESPDTPDTKPNAHADHAGHTHDAPKPGDADAPAANVYVCPMHPEVTSTNPQDRCPKCGMNLVRQDAEGGS